MFRQNDNHAPVSDHTVIARREKPAPPPVRPAVGPRKPGAQLIVVYDSVDFVMTWKKPRQNECEA